MVCGEGLGEGWMVGRICVWGWLKPLHQMCALCDNEHHGGMRGGRGKGMGGVGQGGEGGEI